MLEEQANEWLWRIFRLYMAELSEPQLDGVLQQLENEIAARQECDNDAARLLFSTLSASDLEIARQQIINAQQIEAEARQLRMCCKCVVSNRNVPMCLLWTPVFTGFSAISSSATVLRN